MPSIQNARRRRFAAAQPLHRANDWDHGEHIVEVSRLGHRRDDLSARIPMGRTRIVRLGIHGGHFGVGHTPLTINPLDTIPATSEETDDVIVQLLHWPDVGETQQAEQSVPDDLAEALQELGEVAADAAEDGLDVPSEVAFTNAERLLRAMYRISPRVYSVYPMPDRYIAIDARGVDGNIAVLMCGSNGEALCLVTINREARRARYSTARELPDGFVREALFALGPEPA